jgi:hypothetical protein
VARPDGAAAGPRQDHPAPSGPPAATPADAQARPPRWAGLGLSEDPGQPPEPSSSGPRPADWPAQDPHPGHFPGDSAPRGHGPAGWPAPGSYPDHSGGHAAHQGSLEHRPAGWMGYDPLQRHPGVPHQPHPAHTVPMWHQAWADYDPYTGYPIWPGHPAYTARNSGLRRLSKLTWRAAEVSAVVAVGFVALFARTAHSAVKNVSAQHSAKASVHAAATHSTPKRHKPKHHHHRHHASPPALAPPAAPPAPPPPPAALPPPAAPPAPAPPPPPATTSGGSGGG